MFCAQSFFMMDGDNDRDTRNRDAGWHTEREFDIVTFVLAAILALTILGAVGYGIFNSSRVASTIPFPTDVQRAAVKAVTQPATEGSGGARKEADHHR